MDAQLVESNNQDLSDRNSQADSIKAAGRYAYTGRWRRSQIRAGLTRSYRARATDVQQIAARQKMQACAKST